MNENKKTLMFVIAAAAAVVAAVLSRPSMRNDAESVVNQPLYPDFTDPLAVTSLEIVEFDDKRGEVIPFRAFDNDWCSSLFMSQDPVAIDSVCLDFLGDEPASLYVQRGLGLDNYLHEAALAYDPPSRTLYRPDGIPLPSLGVHEHWNNPIDRQYSRNLGLDAGIELVAVRLRRAGELDADLVSDGVVDERDLAAFCRGWLAVPGDSSWSESLDLSGDQRTDFRDWASLAREWGGRTRPWEMNAGPDRGRAALYEGR